MLKYPKIIIRYPVLIFVPKPDFDTFLDKIVSMAFRCQGVFGGF